MADETVPEGIQIVGNKIESPFIPHESSISCFVFTNSDANSNSILSTPDTPIKELETSELDSEREDVVTSEREIHECDKEPETPPHHARRPMNAFLIFCKRHRPVVRDKYPHLENRSITKILGEWWANIDPEDKKHYTGLAKEYKDAFLKGNPNFKWYKLPAPPLRTLTTRPSNAKFTDYSVYDEPAHDTGDTVQIRASTEPLDDPKLPLDTDDKTTPVKSKPRTYSNIHRDKYPQSINNIIKKEAFQPESNTEISKSETLSIFNLGKLADESQLGGLSSLISPYQGNNNNNNNTITNSNNRYYTESADEAKFSVAVSHGPYSLDQSINDQPKETKVEINQEDALQDALFETKSFFEKTFELTNKYVGANDPFAELKNHAQKQMVNMSLKSHKHFKNNNQMNDFNKMFRTKMNIRSTEPVVAEIYSDKNNVTQQDIIDKVIVSQIHRSQTEVECEENIKKESAYSAEPENKEEDRTINEEEHIEEDSSIYADDVNTRKSYRACKGKRYQEFMSEGRLLINKRSKKYSYPVFNNKSNVKEFNGHSKKAYDSTTASEPELNETIIKLAERANIIIKEVGSHVSDKRSKEIFKTTDNPTTCDRRRTISETSESKLFFQASDFDLDAKIEALPPLSLELFQQKKRDGKKKRRVIKEKKKKVIDTDNNNAAIESHYEIVPQKLNFDIETKISKAGFMNIATELFGNGLVGSRKRKARKQSITRHDPTKPTSDQDSSPLTSDLFGLATLAEVAAKKSKIDDS